MRVTFGLRTESVPAEPGQDVPIPKPCVAAPGARGEVRNRVEPPPVLGELGERLLAAVEGEEFPGPFTASHLGVEGLGVSLTSDDLRAVASSLAPPDPPDGPVLALHPLNAHGDLRSQEATATVCLGVGAVISRVQPPGGSRHAGGA
jgi:hypothetical protein